MSREKKIEEMANFLFTEVDAYDLYREGECIALAKDLYEANFRKQEWISVEDRLPEKSGDYLTYHEHRSCGVLYYNADIKLWNVYYSDDVRNAIRSITHWMPLPEAPKMKGESNE